jgi:hypothetical protein
MAGRRVNTYVHGVDAKGNSFVVGPDDTVTDEQAAAITNEDVWAADEADAPTDLGEAELGDRNADSRIVVTEGSQVVTAPEPREEAPPAETRDIGEMSAAAGADDLATANQDSNVNVENAAPAVVPEPPRQGPGASKAAWVEYARSRGVEVDPNSMNRDDIIEAVDAGAGVPVEDEPDEGTED